MEQYALAELLQNGAGMGQNIRSRMSGLQSASDYDMDARNSKLGGEVPGLPGMRFGADLPSAMATAAKSSAQFHSGDLNKMMSHPAVGWSKSMAGIDGLAGGEIYRITGDTENRLGEKGIYRDTDGSWKMRGLTGSTSGQAGPGAGIKSTGIAGPARRGTSVVPSPGLGGVPQGNTVPTSTRQMTTRTSEPATVNGVPQTSKVPSPGLGGVPATPQTQSSVAQGLSGLGDRIRQSVQSGLSSNQAMPQSGVSPIGGSFRTGILGQMKSAGQQTTTPPGTAPATSPPASQPMNVAAPGPAGTTPTSSGGALGTMAQEIIRQETGGQDLTGQTNCTIRPEAGCLALNSGIFESTAASMGLDFNQIVNDPVYAAQAVEQLLAGYANDDASQWGGPAGMTVWEWGQQNLPGGGAEAVSRIYFGGDVSGQFVDEQGRSGATYGQQFMDKMYATGYNPATAGSPSATPAAAPAEAPATGTAPMNPEAAAQAKMLGGAVQPSGGQGELPLIQGGERLIPEEQPLQDPSMGMGAMGYMHPGSQLGTSYNNQQQGQAGGIAAPGAGGAIGDPQGIVQAPLQMGNAQGMNWDSVNQWDAEIAAAVAKYPEVDPAMIKAAMAMESLGNPQAKNPASSSYGVLQIQPEWHRDSARQLGLTLSADGGTPADDIEYFAALMAGKAPGQQVNGATPLDRYINNYQQPPGYRADVESMMNEIHAAGGSTGVPTQNSPPAGPPGVGDVGALGVKIIPTPSQFTPGGGQRPAPQQPSPQGTNPLAPLLGTGNTSGGGVDPNRPSGMMVGADAAQSAPQSNNPFNSLLGTGKMPVSQLPTDPNTGMKTDPDTGTPVTSAGGDAPPTSRPPKNTGGITPMTTPNQEMTGISQGSATPQGDGLGIYAGPDADESWVGTLSPNGGVNGDYKEFVCSERYGEYGCCQGGSCSYASSEAYLDGANQTVHPGYDIALENGTPFYAPIGGVVVGTLSQSGMPGCSSPGGTNECSWAYDNGLVIGGITDSEGGEIYINFDHTSPDESLVGQEVTAGTPLGVGLDKGHVHVEAHGYCEDSGKMVVLDPSLVMGGFYNSHSACEGVTRPVAAEPSGGGTSPGYMGTQAYQDLKGGYQQSQQQQSAPPEYSQGSSYVAPAQQQSSPAPLPPPSYYDSGTAPATTGQVVTTETGDQYEVRPDGTMRLIYSPSW